LKEELKRQIGITNLEVDVESSGSFFDYLFLISTPLHALQIPLILSASEMTAAKLAILVYRRNFTATFTVLEILNRRLNFEIRKFTFKNFLKSFKRLRNFSKVVIFNDRVMSQLAAVCLSVFLNKVFYKRKIIYCLGSDGLYQERKDIFAPGTRMFYDECYMFPFFSFSNKWVRCQKVYFYSKSDFDFMLKFFEGEDNILNGNLTLLVLPFMTAERKSDDLVRKIFLNLPPEEKILVKFHPRERRNNKTELLNLFKLRDLNVEELKVNLPLEILLLKFKDNLRRVILPQNSTVNNFSKYLKDIYNLDFEILELN